MSWRLDQTRAVTEGIKEIVKTLLSALALVILWSTSSYRAGAPPLISLLRCRYR